MSARQETEDSFAPFAAELKSFSEELQGRINFIRQTSALINPSMRSTFDRVAGLVRSAYEAFSPELPLSPGMAEIILSPRLRVMTDRAPPTATLFLQLGYDPQRPIIEQDSRHIVTVMRHIENGDTMVYEKSYGPHTEDPVTRYTQVHTPDALRFVLDRWIGDVGGYYAPIKAPMVSSRDAKLV